MRVDPLADQFPSQTPYLYAYNNPIRFIDVDGLYGDENEANKAQQNAVEKYGADRVGDVYFNTDNNEYAFQIFGEGKDKYTHSTQEGVMGYRPDISVYNNSQYDDYNTKSSNVGLGLAALGLGSELLQKSLIDNKAKTWYDWSRMTYGDAKVRSLSYTGSPLSTSKTQIARYNAFASNLVTSKTLSIAGKGLGAYNALDLINQRRSGQIGDFQFFAEQGSNAFSTLGGIPGAAWGVGWEAGRHISKKKWYHKYIYLYHNPGGRDGLLSTYK